MLLLRHSERTGYATPPGFADMNKYKGPHDIDEKVISAGHACSNLCTMQFTARQKVSFFRYRWLQAIDKTLNRLPPEFAPGDNTQ